MNLIKKNLSIILIGLIFSFLFSVYSINKFDNYEIRTDNQKYLTEKRASEIRKGIAKNDDVLFAHNATVGPTTILKTSYPKVILGTSLTYFRCNKNKIFWSNYQNNKET